jgi:hypothetical protein
LQTSYLRILTMPPFTLQIKQTPYFLRNERTLNKLSTNCLTSSYF